MELKSQGSIHTTSEERTGDLHTGYVDIISSHQLDAADAIEVTPRSKYMAAVSPTHTGHHPHEGSSYSQRNFAKKSSSDSTMIAGEEGGERSSNGFSSIAGGGVRRGGKQPSRAEIKIQEEMNELLRREEELRFDFWSCLISTCISSG